jgi:hypothetical protein
METNGSISLLVSLSSLTKTIEAQMMTKIEPVN